MTKSRQTKKVARKPKRQASLTSLVTLVLVDDHTIVREGVTALLHTHPGIKVVGECSEPASAIPLVHKLQPHILLLDLVLRDKHGLDVLRKVRGRTKVIILSMRSDELYAAEALFFGASGYLLKEATSSELLQAVKEVHAGRTYLSSTLNHHKVYEILQDLRKTDPDPLLKLTSRERTILPLAAEGHTSAEIASRLSISPRTVEVHRARLMKKLQLKSQTDLVRFAARKNFVAL